MTSFKGPTFTTSQQRQHLHRQQPQQQLQHRRLLRCSKEGSFRITTRSITTGLRGASRRSSSRAPIRFLIILIFSFSLGSSFPLVRPMPVCSRLPTERRLTEVGNLLMPEFLVTFRSILQGQV